MLEVVARVGHLASCRGGGVDAPPPCRSAVVTGRWQLGPDRKAAQQARREAVQWLGDHSVASGDAALVIAELLANAVRAARGVVRLEVSIEEGRVSIAVSDDGPGLDDFPVDTLPPLDAEGSRGLFLVRQLSSGLQLDEAAVGTTVRCWLPAQSPGPGKVGRDSAP